jgi:hypothetical protein
LGLAELDLVQEGAAELALSDLGEAQPSLSPQVANALAERGWVFDAT